MRTHYLTVTGMTGGESRNTVAEALGVLPGVGMVRVSPTHSSVTVHFNEQYISIGELTAAIEESGFGIDTTGPIHTHRIPGAGVGSSKES